MYNLACEELESKLKQSIFSDDISVTSLIQQANAREVIVDRLAVQATRTQIELLVDANKTKEIEIESLRNELLNIRNECNKDMESLHAKYNDTIDHLKQQLKDQTATANGCRCELLIVKQKVEELTMKIANKEAEFKKQLAKVSQSLEDGTKLSPRSLTIMPSPRIAAPAEPVRELPTSPRVIQKFTRFQAIIRGILGRKKFKQKKITTVAKSTNVLVAMDVEEQGSGASYF